MIWILGEYAAHIDNAKAILESFANTFSEETSVVQLQLLTAVVKLFLVKSSQNQSFVEKILALATQQSDNPDLRDRGYVYWRLLSLNPEAARKVVFADKPPVSDDSDQLDASILNILISNISTLASIYHKPPEYFLKEGKSVVLKKVSSSKKGEEEEEEEDEEVTSPKKEAPAEDEEDDREVEREDGELTRSSQGSKTSSPYRIEPSRSLP